MAQRASIGQYYSVDSPIHHLDPRVKFVGTVVYMASCLFVDSFATLLLAALVAAGAVATSNVPVRRLLAQIKPIAFFLIVTSVINLFFVQTGSAVVALSPLVIYQNGLVAAALYTIRFFLLVLAGSLLTLTTTPVALTDAVEKLLSPLERAGVPVSQGTLILSIALRFVPTLSQETENIIAAQTARGADLENKGAFAYARACVPLVVPLFASALRHAENLGRAMDARCYTGSNRTHYHILRMVPSRDYPAIALLITYIALLVAAHFLL